MPVVERETESGNTSQKRSRVAVVTFAGEAEARVEQRLAGLTSEAVRMRVADTIPDNQHKLSNLRERCVACGVQVKSSAL